jgi:hypothetical protein
VLYVATTLGNELQAAGGLYDAVRNTAGVTRQQNGGDTLDQLVIRGIAVQNRINYRLNGSVPMENKERAEALKGASALYYGFTSPAGVVNFVTKRAGHTPVTSAGLTTDDQGTAATTTPTKRRLWPQCFIVRLPTCRSTLRPRKVWEKAKRRRPTPSARVNAWPLASASRRNWVCAGARQTARCCRRRCSISRRESGRQVVLGSGRPRLAAGAPRTVKLTMKVDL